MLINNVPGLARVLVVKKKQKGLNLFIFDKVVVRLTWFVMFELVCVKNDPLSLLFPFKEFEGFR